MPTLSPETLRGFITDLFAASGAAAESASIVAENMVEANLRGVDSHGVQLAVYYLERLHTGDIDPRAHGEVVTENGACIVFDGHNGLGQVHAAVCCDHAVRLAKQYGLGMVSARNCGHFGAVAFWTGRIARAGCIGVVQCNASPIVPPWQAREPRFGTNPLSLAVPGGRWLLDMASTTVAAGKVFKAKLTGQPTIPEGWALDKQGVPTTNTDEAYAGMLAPLGGYKGTGLAMMAEILSALLAGGAVSTELGSIRQAGRPFRASHMYLAIDVARFRPLEEFEAHVSRWVDHVKSAAPAPGYDEVLVAGEPEERVRSERLRTGIPIPDGIWDPLVAAARRLQVRVPE